MTQDVEQGVTALEAGLVVLLPTDTVYGIAALPTVPGATARLFGLKDRSAGQPLAVLVADVGQAMALIDAPSAAITRLMAECWPGPLTLVVRRAASARALELGGDPTTIGVRCPDHDLVRELASRVGPIATTSANRHGEPTPATAAAAAAALTGPVAVLIDGGRLDGLASTVVDVSGDQPRILRVGAIAAAAVERLLAGT